MRTLYFCPVVSSIYLSSFFHGVALVGILWFGSETCCTQLAENTGCKNSPSEHHCTTLSGHIFATKARIDY